MKVVALFGFECYGSCVVVMWLSVVELRLVMVSSGIVKLWLMVLWLIVVKLWFMMKWLVMIWIDWYGRGLGLVSLVRKIHSNIDKNINKWIDKIYMKRRLLK